MSKKKKKAGTPVALPNYPYKGYTKVICHDGNSILLRHEKTKATLEIGGWSRGAKHQGMALVDHASRIRTSARHDANTAGEQAFASTLAVANQRSEYPVLSLEIKDFDVPDFPDITWANLAADVFKLLDAGTSVLLTCQGGHGRSGMSAAILSFLLYTTEPGTFGKWDGLEADPVAWVRDRHCHEAVETDEQEIYVYTLLGFDALADEVEARKVAAKPGGKPGLDFTSTWLPIGSKDKCYDCKDNTLAQRVCPLCGTCTCYKHYVDGTKEGGPLCLECHKLNYPEKYPLDGEAPADDSPDFYEGEDTIVEFVAECDKCGHEKMCAHIARLDSILCSACEFLMTDGDALALEGGD